MGKATYSGLSGMAKGATAGIMWGLEQQGKENDFGRKKRLATYADELQDENRADNQAFTTSERDATQGFTGDQKALDRETNLEIQGDRNSNAKELIQSRDALLTRNIEAAANLAKQGREQDSKVLMLNAIETDAADMATQMAAKKYADQQIDEKSGYFSTDGSDFKDSGGSREQARAGFVNEFMEGRRQLITSNYQSALGMDVPGSDQGVAYASGDTGAAPEAPAAPSTAPAGLMTPPDQAAAPEQAAPAPEMAPEVAPAPVPEQAAPAPTVQPSLGGGGNVVDANTAWATLTAAPSQQNRDAFIKHYGMDEFKKQLSNESGMSANNLGQRMDGVTDRIGDDLKAWFEEQKRQVNL
jgi:hypothetical protein